jgi:signal transduction histidine kinase
MNIFLGGAVIISSLIALAAAIGVLMRAPHEPVRRWLAVLLFSAAAWTVVVNLQTPLQSPEYNTWIIRLTFMAAIVMLYAMVRFVTLVTGIGNARATIAAITGATAVTLVAALTPLTISGVRYVDGMVVPRREWFYAVILIVLVSLMLYSILMAVYGYVRTRRRHVKYRLGLLALGLTGGIATGTLTNIILPNLMGSIEPARYAWIGLLIWTITLVYVVVRHHLLDVRLAVVRTVAYFLILLSLIGVYFGVAFVLSWLLHTSTATTIDVVINVAIALLLALIFQPTKYFFDRLTRRVFYRGIYNTDDFFAQLNRELGATIELRTLLRRAAETIGTTFNAEQSFFFVRYAAGERYISAGTVHHSQFLPRDSEALERYLLAHDETVLVADLIDDAPLRSFLRSHRIALVLPLRHAEGVLGYLFLGDRRSGGYVRHDLRTLGTIADELAIAIQNTLSVQEVKELNATLQQRIQDATKELRTSNNQLQKLDQAKDEFVSMASHQLRTPLTSVKGYISMVLEGDAGKITPMQTQLLTEAFASSERMVHLINDFLNVSRLQTGKFMLDARPIDLAKVVGQEVDSLKTVAGSRNLTLQYRPPSRFPILYVDEGKLRQVVMNFIDNAIYYSREHTAIKVKLSLEGADVLLEVYDTGIGVPESEQAHLFSKFFRATNARKQRPDGTGVGLYLAKKVITAHGGSMVFSSVEGEGSVFGFRLPVKKLVAAPASDANELNN